MSKIDVGADLDIDKFHLDEELLRQPSLCYRYGELLAIAREEMDEAKLNLDVITAQLDEDFRKAGDATGRKMTEDRIKMAIKAEDAFVEASQVFIETNKKVNILYAITRALEHKKDSIAGLLRLQNMEYWSDPGVREKMEEARCGEDTRTTVQAKLAARRGRE